MTINLTELRDEPLGKHPIQAALVFVLTAGLIYDSQQDVVAADDESSFTFDVDGLSDEALDPRPAVYGCVRCTLCLHVQDSRVRHTQGRRAVAAMRNPI